MKRLLLAMTVLTVTVFGLPTTFSHASGAMQNHTNAVVVTVDQAKVFRVSRPAATVIIGNPSIVDGTVEDDQTIVLTGRSFGVTNLIVLDENGDSIVDRKVVVQGSEVNTVRVYRRSVRETLACAPVCEVTLTIGDSSSKFEASAEQIQLRNGFSEGSAE